MSKNEYKNNLSWRAEGPRVYILPFAIKNLTERYIGWLNDPEITRYSELRHRTHTLDTCRQYLDATKDGGHLFGAIYRKDDDLHIGNISAYFDRSNGVVDIAILIGERQVWGNGLGCEAWIAMMNLLVRQNLARKITGGTMAINKPMLRVFEQSGMHEEARRKRHFVSAGFEVDAVYFARFTEEGEVEF